MDGRRLPFECVPVRADPLFLYRIVLLFMIILVALHGFDILSFGPEGWRWLGITVGVGGGGLRCLTEKLLGRYRRAG